MYEELFKWLNRLIDEGESVNGLRLRLDMLAKCARELTRYDFEKVLEAVTKEEKADAE